MAITVYPLNDIDYVAEDVSTYLSTRSSGIYAGDDFMISLTGSDNTISIDTGLAWMRLSKFNGIAVAMKSKTSVDMGIPDATYPRIDALVLRFDANKNGAELAAKPGVASSNPRPPAISQTEALYELHLLHVLRQPGAASITAADVTDLRLNDSYCGLMADSVTKINMDAINAQAMALIEQLRVEISGVKDGSAFVMKSGDTMTGPLNVPPPVGDTNAANKAYVDSRHFVVPITIPTAWVQNGAVYTQTIPVAGIQATDTPHIGPVLSSDYATRQAQKEAFSIIGSGRAETGDGTITFTCDDEAPSIEIPIQIEVNR